MTQINHRRRNRKPVNQRLRPEEYNNGDAPPNGKEDAVAGVGKTDYLHKANCTWSGATPLSGERISAGLPHAVPGGHRGMAKAVKGAKKFVRTRVRFHENAETRRLALQEETENGSQVVGSLDPNNSEGSL